MKNTMLFICLSLDCSCFTETRGSIMNFAANVVDAKDAKANTSIRILRPVSCVIIAATISPITIPTLDKD